MFLCLNPRFDGAFLNSQNGMQVVELERLNPRFDGAFLNSKPPPSLEATAGLNPRFDGAFLNCKRDTKPWKSHPS